MALLAAGLASPTWAQEVEITHEAPGCVAADTVPRLEARLIPADAVGRAQVHFRSGEAAGWYSVPLRAPAESGSDLFVAVLPRPTRELERFDYYIDVTTTAMTGQRTEEFSPRVVGRASDCRDEIVASGVASGAISVSPPAGTSGLPAVPAGFSTLGVVPVGVATGVSGAATAIGGASAGGISGGKLALAGVAVAGAAAGTAVALSGDDDGLDVNGAWTGMQVQRPELGSQTCEIENGLSLSLSQQGTVLTGTLRTQVRRTTCSFLDVGDSLDMTLEGALSGTTITFTARQVTAEGTRSGEYTGTVTGDSMSGTLASQGLALSGAGTWSVRR